MPKKSQKLFAKECGCINHDIFVCSSDEEFKLRTRKHFLRRREYEELLRRNLIDRRVLRLCTICLQYARKKLSHNGGGYSKEENNVMIDSSSANLTDFETINQLPNASNINDESDLKIDSSSANLTDFEAINQLPNAANFTDGKGKSVDESFRERLQLLTAQLNTLPDWGQLDNCLKKDLCNLSKALGNIIKKDLYKEKDSMAQECKSFISLISVKPSDWYDKRNPLLTEFLIGCTGVTGRNDKNKKINSCLHSIEQILYTRNNNIVTPFSLQRNIIMYSVTKSKLGCSLLGSWESSGGYTKVNQILNSKSDPLTITSSSDVVITFDNELKVGKYSGRIRENSKQKVSIITTIAAMELLSKYQFSPYLRLNLSQSESIEAVNSLEEHYKTVMRAYRTKFIAEILEEVFNEQKTRKDDSITDYVDIATTLSESYVCLCSYSQTTLFETCPHCEENTCFYDHAYDKYYRTKSCHVEAPKIEHAEPSMVNPNGFKNIIHVLKQIQEHAIDSSSHEWVTVTCDGVPYTYASEIQDDSVACSTCHEVIRKCEKLNHFHHGEKSDFTRPFPNLLIRSGPGHIELNMARKLLKFLWLPMMKDLSFHLGFRTLKAQMVFQAGIDHHRSKEILETLLFALSKELVLPYVRQCLDVSKLPSPSGYLNWFDKYVASQNYSFLYHVTFSYLLAFHLYNEGVRKNNSDNMMAARTTFHPLFFTSHHPKYQKLHLRDMIENYEL